MEWDVEAPVFFKKPQSLVRKRNPNYQNHRASGNFKRELENKKEGSARGAYYRGVEG